jgi:beta-xylosidase
MRYIVQLSREATEIASIEVIATSEVEAVNIAFKEIDRLKDTSQDKRVEFVELTLKPNGGSIWEEVSVEPVK